MTLVHVRALPNTERISSSSKNLKVSTTLEPGTGFNHYLCRRWFTGGLLRHLLFFFHGRTFAGLSNRGLWRMISVWGPLGRFLSLDPLAWWRCRRGFLGRSSLLTRFGRNRRLRRLLSSVRLWFFLLFRGRRTGTSWATWAGSLGRWGWSWGRSFSTWLGFTSRRIWPSWRWFSTFRPEKATRLCHM